MVEFLCIMGSFFFITFIVMERLSYGIKVDSTQLDMRDIWSSYNCTLEDMKLKKE
ncbi:hypothetical protein [Ammoniphilus sp. CFH 90114]|uniref:hypothetical protein n=1 Tax=Ammoniphilus sp. CFH 90114 TaxID=2493665 RepID=UPI0013E945D6|nr:hypothetical protein [Ammoniphilus sp. CFH 90114]